MPQPRHALILTAGLGARLRPLSSVRAKPAMPVAGEPMIRRIIAWLVEHGADELVLNLHHLPHTITRIVGDGSDLSATVRYSWEPELLGSAGGPRRALPIIGAETFFIVNGDTLADVDLRVLAEAHEASGALVTLALAPNRSPGRYGGVAMEADGRVTGFRRRGVAGPSFHFVGVQIVDAGAFQALPDGRPANSVGGLYDELIAARPGSLRGVLCDAAFWDVGTPGDYWRTSLDWAARDHAGVLPPGRGVRIAPTARVSDSILWDDVEVGSGCQLEACIVTDGVRVPPGARHARRILVRHDDGRLEAFPYA
ncbi:MAG: NDP-sugar synthase [Acidobacteria bacterium]|nr:NDP-sugar synthase [Acidobacteriota bacterium]